MKSIDKINLFGSVNLILIFTLTAILFYPGCKELPSESEGPDNPLDPDNPNNNIHGPALVLSPTRVKIDSGEQFQLELWIVESDSFAGLSTRIMFEPSEIAIKSIDSLTVNSESFMLQNGGQLIWFCSMNSDSGFIQIDCAVVEAKPHNVIGTGIISKIVFQHIAGQNTTMTISDQSYLRDNQNNELKINSFFNTDIAVN